MSAPTFSGVDDEQGAESPARSRSIRGWLSSDRTYRRLAIVVTAGVAFLTIAGAGVRLTGSGLGCDDWPRCNETRFIDVSTGHAAIEQLNRLLSGVIGVPTLLFVVSAFLVGRRQSGLHATARRGLRWPALGVLAMILGNGVVGGLAVLGDLHPTLVQSHFVLAMIAMAFGMVAIAKTSPRWFPAAEPADSQRGRITAARLAPALGLGTAAALLTGTVVTGTGPHAGDENARRFGFDLGSVARIHSITVLVTAGLALLIGWRVIAGRERLAPHVQAAFTTWIAIAILQGTLGYSQYFADVPALMAWVHVIGATAMWTVTMTFVLRAVGGMSGQVVRAA